MWYTSIMEHIKVSSKHKEYTSVFWQQYFKNRSVGVLDIETTGLSRERCHFILGGLYDPQESTLHQIFADHIEEEAEALAAFMELTERFDVVVTYNGRHFDLPFLAERIHRTGRGRREGATVLPYSGYDLDLYQVVNGHSPIRRLLPNLRQKTVESYMGLWTDRSDEISGAESVELYMHYMQTKDPEARRQILLHNSDDVLQLTRLIPVIEKSDFHRAMHRMGFPAGSPELRWQVRQIRFQKDRIGVEGTQGGRRISYRGYQLGEFPMHTLFDAKAGSFQMEIPIVRQGGIAAVDLRIAGIDEKKFEKYPGFGSGFLVVEDRDGVKYREVNLMVQEIIALFEESIKWN